MALFIWPQITPRSLNKTRKPDPEQNGFEIGGTLDPAGYTRAGNYIVS